MSPVSREISDVPSHNTNQMCVHELYLNWLPNLAGKSLISPHIFLITENEAKSNQKTIQGLDTLKNQFCIFFITDI